MSIAEATEAEVKPRAVFEWRPFIPQGASGPAETPVEALLRAQRILLDEERWVKSAWYAQENPQLDPDDPFCDGWNVCAAGAVWLVTVGPVRQCTRIKWEIPEDVGSDYKLVPKDIPTDARQWAIMFPENLDESTDVNAPVLPEGVTTDVYEEAVEYLRRGANAVTGRHYHNVPAFNDDVTTTRVETLAAFSQAISFAAADAAKGEAKDQVKRDLLSAVGLA